MVTTITWFALLGAFLLVLAGEALHLRRVRRIANLAFGPTGRPAHWVRVVPLLRALAAAAVTFGLATLLQLPPKTHALGNTKPDEVRHLLIVLDVSPSMQLQDAGPGHVEQRNQRARELLKSLFERVAIGNYAISVVAVYNGAKPVVVDSHDAAVIDNVLGDLPLRFAFQPGKTRLFDGIEEAARIAKPWKKNSAILAILSDGDTVPASGMPTLPTSVGSVLVVGVGDPSAGKFIDGKQSRQDVSTLRQIAARLNGVYHNGNERHIPTDVVREITAVGDGPEGEKLTLREYALIAVAAGAALLALLPLALHLLGTAWRAGVHGEVLTRDGAGVGRSRRALVPEANAVR